MLTPQRPSLRQTVQQHEATAMSAIVGAQFAPLATASFTPDPELDEFPADTTSASITATMKPGESCIAGKPYVFRKKAAGNSYTIAFSNSETYEGASTIVLSDDNAVAAIMWDAVSAEWVRASAAGVGGDVPVGALAAANNLDDLDSASTALDNLGGTAVGKAVFIAVSAAAARTATGAAADAEVQKKTDTQSFGPFSLSLVAADADKIRFQPRFACVVIGVVAVQTHGTVATGTAVATLTTTAGAPTANTLTHNIADAANQARTMTPTGGNCAVGATDFVDLSITGTNDGAGTRASYTIQYTRT